MKTKVEEAIIIKPLKEILNMIDKDKYEEILKEALDNFNQKKKRKLTKEDQEGYITGDMLAKYISLLLVLNNEEYETMKKIIEEKKISNKKNALYNRMIENNIIFNIDDTYYLPEEMEGAYKKSDFQKLTMAKIKVLISYYIIINGLIKINKLIELVDESGYKVTKKDILEVIKENNYILNKDIIYLNEYAKSANKNNKLLEIKELFEYKVLPFNEALEEAVFIEMSKRLEEPKKILQKKIKDKDKLENTLEMIFNIMLLNVALEEHIKALLKERNIDLKQDEEKFYSLLKEQAHELPSWCLNGASEHELFCMDEEDYLDYEELSDEEKKEIYVMNYVGINGIISIDKLLEILNSGHNLKTTKKDILEIAKENEFSIIENYVCVDSFSKQDFVELLTLKKHKEYKIIEDIYIAVHEMEDNQIQLEFILEKYNLNESTKDEIINLIRIGILNEDMLMYILENNNCKVPLKKQKTLYKELKKVINTTRNWILNGFTYEEERKMNAKVNEKIKRNDLCPCGSGLKYKKCCGK